VGYVADPVVGTVVSHYAVLARLGQGAQGVVYLAHDLTLEREVALKFLHPASRRNDQAIARLMCEARAAAAATHPNNCRIHGVESTEDGELFIVMAYYAGQTLRQRLRQGRLPIDEAISIGTSVVDGLTAAHARGIVHRDITPDNIMLTPDGVIVLDFGIAHANGSPQPRDESVSFGTPAYMSPEQSRCDTTDARSDLWSAGVVLYEMIGGQIPFAASSPDVALSAVRHDRPLPLEARDPAVPAALDAIVLRALRHKPQQRFQTALDLSRALRSVQAHRRTVRATDRLSEAARDSRSRWTGPFAMRLPA
jgi:serine/threonine protein kinase